MLTTVMVTRAPGNTALDIGIKSPDGSRRQPDAHVTALAANFYGSIGPAVRPRGLSLPPD
ncbi:hypothetical protein GCM10010302_05590 [Streptomyces polychromogenes]|uniref:Uncharacterized protein n=1 Tax=Streptomyces polychromogenes TaxID=67342 RepID=A0ABP3ERE2_9ACTN